MTNASLQFVTEKRELFVTQLDTKIDRIVSIIYFQLKVLTKSKRIIRDNCNDVNVKMKTSRTNVLVYRTSII